MSDILKLIGKLKFIRDYECKTRDEIEVISMEEVYKRIIIWYGRKAQTIKACEELSELMDVLCKGLNKKMDLEALAEEMADVQVMIEQLKIMYKIPEQKLYQIRSFKLDRTQRRMAAELDSSAEE